MKEKITQSSKTENKGFTLIELLVVVLIIGILAAIALPQYRKTVLKSKFATVKQNAKALWEANQRYYMVNNKYTTHIDDLDIQVTNNITAGYYYSISDSGAADGRYELNLIRLEYWVYGPASTLCIFSSENSSVFNRLDNFCKQETNNGKRGCNSSTTCYYYYNSKP